ncbi:MAG: bifunctional metallophosphatase/5'-nucleotidase, partial [Acidobacteriota bacterium]|nr:bifunctional metallophosphatase/5'-nucleotidase [Acidobacteriota bacterium]
GSRIQQLFVNGDAIDADRPYTVAFITSQGVPEKYGSNRRELPISAIDALRRYFGNHPAVNADLRGAVVVV